jgi:predicted nucleic acid-binding protein
MGWRALIFVDTTFWVGDADSNDDFHPSAHAAIEAIRSGKTPTALTTNFVLDETVTILGRRKGFGAEKASRVATIILSSPRVFTVHIDEALFKESLKLYPSYKGELSLTSVSTLVTMRSYGVREVYSHDRHFDHIDGVRRREEP